LSKKVPTNWIGLPDNFNVKEWEGFVYLVRNTLTGQGYIGRKYFWAKTRQKVKGRTRRKRIVKESDWRFYKSSSEELKRDISRLGLGVFEFHVLSLHRTRGETNYCEVKEQFVRDVLYSKLPSGEYEYLNNCILSRYHRHRNYLTNTEE